jgi:hypothetical protein
MKLTHTLIATLALTLATPALAGQLVDSSGKPVGSKFDTAVDVIGNDVPAAAAATQEQAAKPAKKHKKSATKKQGKKKYMKKKGKKAKYKKAPAKAEAVTAPAVVESTAPGFRARNVEKR